ncbi:MAG: peptide-modifying radical SAM enzyme CbpB [Alphaproteobacteria bacterium]|nr:peptide-modifying radical SAM enzyme CbpB [Alphaproteobacteria bacterium]
MRRVEAEGSATSPRAPLQPFDIGHATHVAVVEPDTAFWGLVRKERLADTLAGGELLDAFRAKAAAFAREMEMLRFRLKPSAVYFNPTARCNLNCSYCYIPEDMRRSGAQMDTAAVLAALDRLDAYFRGHMPPERLPQVIFHGAEPLLARKAIFAAIAAYGDRFRFGVQTNATLLDDAAVSFLTARGVGIGLSLDGPIAAVADRTRRRWSGRGVFDRVVRAIDRLDGYPGFNVICTMTAQNLPHLVAMVEFLHRHRVPACMLNVTRCTLPAARSQRGDDDSVWRAYLAALERTHALYRVSGRKLVVANFANILIAILAPTARRLMCDISPCGGGRSFFALAPNGDLFPCSEFIGLPAFAGGNLFRQPVEEILDSPPFRLVTGRTVEDVAGCRTCPVRHFCGSPCPAEAHEMNGGMTQKGAFCRFYEEQARYALRVIADGRHEDFLWDGWDAGTEATCTIGST